MNGPAPFGMRRNGGDLLPDLSEAPVVRELVEAFVASGGRLRATAAALNLKGYRTRRGASWSDTSVSRVLRNPSLSDLVPKNLWRRYEGLLPDRAEDGSPPRRRSVHPLGGVVHCRCGGRMYLRGNGPTGKYVCRSCRAKIAQDTLETLFRKSLSSVEIPATEIVSALEDNPQAAELNRMLGGRSVPISEVWPLLDRPRRCQLVDHLVAQIVLGRDEISVVFAESGAPEGENGPFPPNSLPCSHGSKSVTNPATKPINRIGRGDLPDLLTVDDVTALLRTSSKSVYSMIDRGQLPGVTRIGRRLRIRRDDLITWLDESRAPSSKEERR